ncbi:MAG: GNAT family N-acetyltransferase, partial [Clostridia bacterium]|nr:GNAT family N-acetyltransferase [Clostridia bacterium]
MVYLEKVTSKNLEELLELNIFESQYPFVADNTESLAEAYVAVTSGEAYAWPFAIYDDETLVGFLMIGYNEAALEGLDAPKALKENYSLWRLLIDKRYQRKGYGREALRLALEFIKTWPRGEAELCVTSYNPENEVAKKLYASFGFTENGEMDEDEIVAVLKLREEPGEDKAPPTVFELEDTSKVEGLFAGWEDLDTGVRSCLQKVMGKIYVTDPENPKSAMAHMGDFAFVAGEP